MSNIVTQQKRLFKRKTPIVIGMLLSIMVVVISATLLFLYLQSNKKATFFDIKNPIIFQGSIYKEEAVIKNDTVYLPLTFIKENMDDSLIFDEQSSSVIITTENKVIQLPNEQLQYTVNDMPPMKLQMPALVTVDGSMYLEFGPLTSIYPFKVQYLEETGAIKIVKHGDIVLPAIVKEEYKNNDKDLRIRVTPNRYAAYVDELIAGEQIEVENDVQNYYFIRKENGIAGYVSKEVVELQDPKMITIKSATISEPEVQTPPLNWPINLTWEAVYSENPDPTKIPVMPGLNVISPTWFSIKNAEGDISNLASLNYVEWAKSKGYHVWAVFSNDFDPVKTHETLKDFQTRKKMIRQLLQYSAMYKLDGINIDFENVNVEDRDLLTQFVEELTAYLHQAGLTVSMDITFISNSENWSMFYDREKLGKIVDYLMVMAYDEHWATSPVAGSVSSLPWVEKNLAKLLEVVPNERLILGIPTYTRIWKEQKTPGGNIEVSSKAYGMEDTYKWISDRNLQPQYYEKSGQDFVQFTDEKEQATYKIWLENEKSLQKRAQLVHKYQLAGIASWNRSFANESMWSIVDQSLKQLEPIKKEEK
ncbi:glycosyl hydrolase family 18 protein [Bacillus sp. Marseille-P3661]|uniref:glycosyl hydrolase family 18 protein n=1 Tax=Bacillus sp. Marseille-P3661 TaxID=1936234 RepID=UPI000C86857A|nr:glycosyl hydrolase family 18 protein [Bacillus sp. Marseille-P3661]